MPERFFSKSVDNKSMRNYPACNKFINNEIAYLCADDVSDKNAAILLNVNS